MIICNSNIMPNQLPFVFCHTLSQGFLKIFHQNDCFKHQLEPPAAVGSGAALGCSCCSCTMVLILGLLINSVRGNTLFFVYDVWCTSEIGVIIIWLCTMSETEREEERRVKYVGIRKLIISISHQVQ